MKKKIVIGLLVFFSVLFVDLKNVEAYWKVENFDIYYQFMSCPKDEDYYKLFCTQGYTIKVKDCLQKIYGYDLLGKIDEDIINNNNYLITNHGTQPKRYTDWNYFYNDAYWGEDYDSSIRSCYRMKKEGNAISKCTIPEKDWKSTNSSAGNCGDDEFEFNRVCYACKEKVDSGVDTTEKIKNCIYYNGNDRANVTLRLKGTEASSSYTSTIKDCTDISNSMLNDLKANQFEYENTLFCPKSLHLVQTSSLFTCKYYFSFEPRKVGTILNIGVNDRIFTLNKSETVDPGSGTTTEDPDEELENPYLNSGCSCVPSGEKIEACRGKGAFSTSPLKCGNNTIVNEKGGFNNYFLDLYTPSSGGKCNKRTHYQGKWDPNIHGSDPYNLYPDLCFERVCPYGYVQKGQFCYKCSQYKCGSDSFDNGPKPEEDYGRADCSVFKGITGPLWTAIRIIAPVLALVMGAVDFLKAVAASDEKAMNKASSDFGKRLAMVAVLFILTYVVNIIVGLIGYGGAGSCM